MVYLIVGLGFSVFTSYMARHHPRWHGASVTLRLAWLTVMTLLWPLYLLPFAHGFLLGMRR